MRFPKLKPISYCFSVQESFSAWFFLATNKTSHTATGLQQNPRKKTRPKSPERDVGTLGPEVWDLGMAFPAGMIGILVWELDQINEATSESVLGTSCFGTFNCIQEPFSTCLMLAGEL